MTTQLPPRTLLYFGTITPVHSSKDPEAVIETVQCIRFPGRVMLQEVRIVPMNARSFELVNDAEVIGQTAPSYFSLEFLVHVQPILPSTSTPNGTQEYNSKSAKPPQKQKAHQYVHAVKVDFNERYGFQAYDLGGSNDACTKFIMIRGAFKHLTLCIYGSSVDDSKHSFMSLEHANQSTELMHTAEVISHDSGVLEKPEEKNKETPSQHPHSSLASSDQQEYLPRTEKPTVHPLSTIEDIGIEEDTSILGEEFLSDPAVADIMKRAQNIGIVNFLNIHDWRLLQPSCRGGAILSYHASPSSTLLGFTSLTSVRQPLDLPNGPWQHLLSYTEAIHNLLDFSDMDISTSEKEQLQETLDGISECFLEAMASAMGERINYEDELSIIVKGISWAMDLFSAKSSVKLVKSSMTLLSLLCVCGEDITEIVLANNLLEALLKLLNPPPFYYVTSLLQSQILQCLLDCIDDPRMIEHLLGWDTNISINNQRHDESTSSLYQRYILPLSYTITLNSRLRRLLKILARKIAVYQACASIQLLVENTLTKHETNDESKNVNGDYEKDSTAESIIQEVDRHLRTIRKAVLYHHSVRTIIDPKDDVPSAEGPSILSYRYLTARRLIPCITVLLSSVTVRQSQQAFAMLISAIGKLIVTFLGTKDGVLFLAEQFQQTATIPEETEEDLAISKETMLTIWTRLLGLDSKWQLEYGASEFVNDARRTPGIEDIWCGLCRSTKYDAAPSVGTEFHEDYDSLCDGDFWGVENNRNTNVSGSDHESMAAKSNWKEASVRQVLEMQSFGFVNGLIEHRDALDDAGLDIEQSMVLLGYHLYATSCVEQILELNRLDETVNRSDEGKMDVEEREEVLEILLARLCEMMLFTVGKQAVSSTIINLKALPTILTILATSLPPGTDTLQLYTMSISGRYALDIFEAILQSSSSLSLTLSRTTFESLAPILLSEPSFKPWIEPVQAYHFAGGQIGVITSLLQEFRKDFTQEARPADPLQETSIVARLIVGLKVLLRQTFSWPDGVMEILMPLPEDVSPGGEGLLNYLLKILIEAADALMKLVNFSEHVEVGTDELTSSEVNSAHVESGDVGSKESAKDEMEKDDTSKPEDRPRLPSSASNITNSGSSVMAFLLSPETVVLRHMLLEMIWYDLLLIRRIYQTAYGDSMHYHPNSERHFRDIFNKPESIDHPLPSQEQSLLKLSLQSFLKLIAGLDRLDWRTSDYFGSIQDTSDDDTKHGQAEMVARVRGLVYRILGMLGSVIEKAGEETIRPDVGQTATTFVPKYFSNYAGYHIVKAIFSFIMEAPENFLSGIYLLQEIFPHPRPIICDQSAQSFGLAIINEERQQLQKYWLQQIKMAQEDFIQAVITLATCNVKSVHLRVQAVIIQVVDLDREDIGLVREMVLAFVRNLRLALSRLTLLIQEELATQHSKMNDTNDRIPFEIHDHSQQADEAISIVSRWLSLLLVLGSSAIGKVYLWDAMVHSVVSSSSSETETAQSLPFTPLLLAIIQSYRAHCASYLALELLNAVISVGSDPAFKNVIAEYSNVFDIPQEILQAITNVLIESICSGVRIEPCLVKTLNSILQVKGGPMAVLANPRLPFALTALLSWIPDTLLSEDVKEEDRVLDMAAKILKVVHQLLTLDFLIDQKQPPSTTQIFRTLISKTIEWNVQAQKYKMAAERIKAIILEMQECNSPSVCQCEDLLVNLCWFQERFEACVAVDDDQNELQQLEVDFGRSVSRILEVLDNDMPDYGRPLKNILYLINDFVFNDSINDECLYDKCNSLAHDSDGFFSHHEIDVEFDDMVKDLLPDFSLEKGIQMSDHFFTNARHTLQMHRGASSLARLDPKSGKNIGGGKAYIKNEFRSIHNNRKANTSRPPSVHVDDFVKGNITPSQVYDGATGGEKRRLSDTTLPSPGRNIRGIVRRISSSAATSGRGVLRDSRPTTGMAMSPMDLMIGWNYSNPMEMAAAGGMQMFINQPRYPMELEVDRRIEDRTGYSARFGDIRGASGAGYYDPYYATTGPPMSPYDRMQMEQSRGMGMGYRRASLGMASQTTRMMGALPPMRGMEGTMDRPGFRHR